jgi:hypothetical protein
MMRAKIRKLIEAKREKFATEYTPGCVFYVIQVSPQDKHRYKFGFSTNMLGTINQFVNIVPDCVLLRKYPCHPGNEDTLYHIFRKWPGLAFVSPKVKGVFDVTDFERFIVYLDAIFRVKDMRREYNDPYLICKDVTKYRD